MDEIITLDFGSGGKKTSRLIESEILSRFSNPALGELGDGAVLPGAEKIVFSTDSFVVSPLFFPGGDIGKLAVCGTVNDIAMCGGEAKYLSLSLIIEEGLEGSALSRILDSIRAAAESARVQVVTGDTKVVERGRGDGVYINTAGIGFLRRAGLTPGAMRDGDAVLISGTAGDHGAVVMLARGGLIDAEALLAGIKARHVGAACLDVYEEESDIFFEDFSGHIVDDDTLARLISMPNVLITSHQAFLTEEALDNIARTTVENITGFFAGKTSANEVCYHCPRQSECQSGHRTPCF